MQIKHHYFTSLLLLFFVGFVFLCSYFLYQKRPTDNALTPVINRDARLSSSLENVVSFMGISESLSGSTYHTTLQFLKDSEQDCIGKDFVQYRTCFINQIQKRESLARLPEDIRRNQIEIFKQSLQKEIENLKHYERVDAMERYEDFDNNPSEKICRTIHIKGYDPTSLSYLPSRFPKLSELFHEKERKYFTDSGEGSGENINPCKFQTWGPVIGNIIAFYETPEYNYFFIKTGDGGGSGEFYYSVFAVGTNSSYQENIGRFENLNGAPPYMEMFLNSKSKKEQVIFKKTPIRELFKNSPFLYKDIFDGEKAKIINTLLEESL